MLKAQIYDACGNIIGIYRTPSLDYLKSDMQTRSELKAWGIEHNVDTVMVYEKSAKGYSTIIFEPQGDTGDNGAGGFSTMCGNGIRALAAHIEATYGESFPLKINTLAGELAVEKIGANYRVKMGYLVQDMKLLAQYVNANSLTALNPILTQISAEVECKDEPITFAIGFSSMIKSRPQQSSRHAEKNQIPDGEPHLAIKLCSGLSLLELRDLAGKFGNALTNNHDVFPVGINSNFYSFSPDGSKIRLVTFERNLGQDPQHAITKACGTGSTFVAGVNFHNTQGKIAVENQGGTLEISIQDDLLFMLGAARILI